MNGIIYKATNMVTGKVYIGLTIQGLEKRKSQHNRKADNRRYTYKFYNAIREHGADAFIWEIVESNIKSKELLKSREIYWIAFYDSFHNGYNSTTGGDGVIFTKEVRYKISRANKGANNSCAKLSELQVGEIKKKLSFGESPLKISRDFGISKQTIHNIKSGFHWGYISPELNGQLKNSIKKRNKVILQYSLSGELVKEHSSIAEACLELGVSHTSISKCCRGQRKSAGGFIWKYKEEKEGSTE